MKITSLNPATNQSVGDVEVTTLDELHAIVEKAQAAKKSWKELGVAKRVELLKKVYDVLYAHRDEIAKLDSQEMGFPIQQCYDFNMGDGFNYFKWNLDNAEKCLAPTVTFEDDLSIHTVYREPRGVVAVIQPWNFPFCQWSWGVVANLLAGNVVVYKPSSQTPLGSKLIENLIATECQLPDGVLSFVYGSSAVGEALVDEKINMLVFTGSTEVGQKLYQKAAAKFIPAVFELGGSAPGIVFADADMKLAESVFWQRYANCGQACDGLKRLIVEKSTADKLVSRLKEIIESASIGDPLQTDTVFGPLSSEKQLAAVEAQVEDAKQKGAQVITGDARVSGQTGAYFQPTLLTNVTPDMKVWREEVFGPVLPVVTFETEAEAIQLANDTEYGLGAYVYTNDQAKAERVAAQIESGMVSINATNYVLPMNPFGGYKKSGLGREHGKYGFEDLTQIKLISRNK